jgi:NAD(P)-dependent dehydrogenase (short-subunit alcohol dehydrogenase family)
MASLNPKIENWQDRSVWIVGASSGIGLALAQALTQRGARVAVSARSEEKLNAFTQSHPDSFAVVIDVQDPHSVAQATQAVASHQGLEVVVYCAGHYLAQDARALDVQQLFLHQEVNYLGAIRVLSQVLPVLLSKGHGHVSLISSVAGYRGLPKSLAYGPTKAALTHLAECLYLDLHDLGIGVSAVLPGFVSTPLTAQNDFEMPALISPEQAALDMIKGYARGEFEIHFPKRFTRVLKVLRCLPYAWYFPLVNRLTRGAKP